MPSLTLQIPHSDFARLNELAKDEGVPVKWWVVWKLKAEAGLPLPPRPACPPNPRQAA